MFRRFHLLHIRPGVIDGVVPYTSHAYVDERLPVPATESLSHRSNRIETSTEIPKRHSSLTSPSIGVCRIIVSPASKQTSLGVKGRSSTWSLSRFCESVLCRLSFIDCSYSR